MSTRDQKGFDQPPWHKPQFRKLGTLRDIAGRGGTGLQSGPNSRARNS